MENLLPANKNIGTTHITNGCYCLHPVEWSIGEAAGLLVEFATERKVIPKKVREDKGLLEGFQGFWWWRGWSWSGKIKDRGSTLVYLNCILISV